MDEAPLEEWKRQNADVSGIKILWENVVLLGNYETLQSAQPPGRFNVGVSTVRIGDEPV
jgi:hypothetical protein